VSLTTKIAMGLVGVGVIGACYLCCGQDTGVTMQFVLGNFTTILLVVQIIVIFIMAVTKNYVAGAILIVSALVTAAARGLIG